MAADKLPTTTPAWQRWTGIVLSGLSAALLLLGGVMNLIQPADALKGAAEIGFPQSCLTELGIAVIVGVALYLFPRTSVLGAIILTGYLGGAVAAHVRMEDWGKSAFPVIFAAVMWGGLWLRDPRLRALVPCRCGG